MSSIERLLAIFNLDERRAQKVWRSTHIDPKGGRMFGGTIIAQALAAARKTVPPSMQTAGISVDFLRPADGGAACCYHVQKLHDGNSSAIRSISATQSAELKVIAMARFRTLRSTSLTHGTARPLVDPERLPATGMPHPARAIPPEVFDIRFYDMREGDTVVRRLWFRTHDALPDDLGVHECAVALISDLYFFEPALLRHGYSGDNRAIKYATIEHSLWFHRAIRADNWLLIESRSPVSSAGRGLVCGEIRTTDGVVVATAVQEISLKLPLDAHRAIAVSMGSPTHTQMSHGTESPAT